MKEFIYTCEYCGAEFKIIEPGEYKCNKCQNTFVIEKEQNKYELSQDEMNDIQKRIAVKQEKVEIAKKQEELKKQEIEKIKAQKKEKEENAKKENEKKKENEYYGEYARRGILALIILTSISAVSMYVSEKHYLGDIFVGDIIILIIAYAFFGLMQRIEFHLRKLAKNKDVHEKSKD